MNRLINLDKKYKYLIYSILMSSLLLGVEFISGWALLPSGILILLLLFVLVSTLVVHYPGVEYKNAAFVFVLPVSIVLGVVFLLGNFPNLSNLLKIVTFMAVGVGLYLVNLVNNIFIVVEEKQEAIPLFRVAVVWSQILTVTLSIPLFAGIFRSATGFLFQNIVAGVIAFLYCFYLLWTFSLDKEVPSIGMGERAVVGLLSFFVVFSSGVSVSFIPTEPFLRALFVSAMLMFCASYLYAHYKNKITKALILEYVSIFIVFLLILLAFKP